jgi:hypothetical protein
MKKLIKASGLMAAGAALSTAAVIAAEGGSKIYTLNAGLRGFWDDNIFTGNNKVDIDNADGDNDLTTGVDKRKMSSFGFEVTPGVRFIVPLENTIVSAGYTYGLRYYEDRPGRSYDQFHLADLQVDHTFNERYKVSIFDNFAVAQEPEQVGGSPGAPNSQLLRAEGNNLRNTAGFDFTAGISPLWSAVLGYRNSYYDYTAPQFSDFLNRMEHLPSLSLRYQLNPKTVTSLNYQFGANDYRTANERDSQSHYIFAGVDHSFTARLVGSIRLGAQFIEWENASGGQRADATNPYADASLTYAYTEGSNVQVGVRHGRNATDLVGVLDQRSTLVYGSINHQITALLRASLVGQYQNAEFVGVSEGIGADGSSEDYMSLGVTLNHKINAYLSAEASYFFDRLTSKIDLRDYNRNRVFVGVRATY